MRRRRRATSGGPLRARKSAPSRRAREGAGAARGVHLRPPGRTAGGCGRLQHAPLSYACHRRGPAAAAGRRRFMDSAIACRCLRRAVARSSGWRRTSGSRPARRLAVRSAARRPRQRNRGVADPPSAQIDCRTRAPSGRSARVATDRGRCAEFSSAGAARASCARQRVDRAAASRGQRRLRSPERLQLRVVLEPPAASAGMTRYSRPASCSVLEVRHRLARRRPGNGRHRARSASAGNARPAVAPAAATPRPPRVITRHVAALGHRRPNLRPDAVHLVSSIAAARSCRAAPPAPARIDRRTPRRGRRAVPLQVALQLRRRNRATRASALGKTMYSAPCAHSSSSRR